MKQLKFQEHLVVPILDGSKTATWRLFDDKDLSVGDKVMCVHADTGEGFAHIQLTDVIEKQLGKIVPADYAGNGKPEDLTTRLAHYLKYYGDTVTTETVVTIAHFNLIDLNEAISK